MKIKDLFDNYTVLRMSDEPGYEWYKLSFEISAKSPEELTTILNELRKEAGLPAMK